MTMFSFISSRKQFHFLLLQLLSLTLVTALIPASPQEQTRRAIRSLKDAIREQKTSNTGGGGGGRFYIDYLIPLPPETKAEDIDPWPGGLAQMYPYAETIIKEILRGIVEEPADSEASSQILSTEDCCGFFIQESKASAKDDVAAIVFPGVDQLDNIEQIDAMVGPERTLLLFNKQFQRPSDFGFGMNTNSNNSRCKEIIFDTFQYGFAFQEFACRGEDTKLTFEYPNWTSCVICDENPTIGRQEIPLLDPSPVRPTYEELETTINQVLPEPLWMRKIGEAEEYGLKFQRKQ